MSEDVDELAVRAAALEYGVELPPPGPGPLRQRPDGLPTVTILWVTRAEYQRLKDGRGTSVIVPADVAPAVDAACALLAHTEAGVPTSAFLYRRTLAVWRHWALREGFVVLDLRPLTGTATTKAWKSWAREVADHARAARLRGLTA